ncbi:hypothetical protein PPL_09820 [Heterostelium album PN500]|uniref:F-box domain-containing protein n=1 Tax=Heterostelium pallidum (strain ATCC 26659 / Pp 5 / PN500) TaxID=670386 RepID=D3BP57_HETP5|nr:hypothetical protein PPL_09820 [Heterostelium album PN500]EFA77067.1 hypothetical protein PPL_09820 [Heterostelium album PN500]|eukprot:XP_020429196.1 hypothetical protein PPL_09820 [Heterostelium album PN500]
MTSSISSLSNSLYSGGGSSGINNESYTSGVSSSGNGTNVSCYSSVKTTISSLSLYRKGLTSTIQLSSLSDLLLTKIFSYLNDYDKISLYYCCKRLMNQRFLSELNDPVIFDQGFHRGNLLNCFKTIVVPLAYLGHLQDCFQRLSSTSSGLSTSKRTNADGTAHSYLKSIEVIYESGASPPAMLESLYSNSSSSSGEKNNALTRLQFDRFPQTLESITLGNEINQELSVVETRSFLLEIIDTRCSSRLTDRARSGDQFQLAIQTGTTSTESTKTKTGNAIQP